MIDLVQSVTVVLQLASVISTAAHAHLTASAHIATQIASEMGLDLATATDQEQAEVIRLSVRHLDLGYRRPRQ